MPAHPTSLRSSRKGLALLVVLVGAVLIAGLAATLRARGVAQAAILSRVEDQHHLAVGRMSVAARVAADVAADDGSAPPANGTTVVMEMHGRQWEVRLADVEGLVDLYLAPADVLSLLPLDGAALAARRDAALRDLVAGARFGSEEQTLARFGFDAAQRAALAPLVTQQARTGEINPSLAPPELRGGAGELDGDVAGGELAEISIRPLP